MRGWPGRMRPIWVPRRCFASTRSRALASKMMARNGSRRSRDGPSGVPGGSFRRSATLLHVLSRFESIILCQLVAPDESLHGIFTCVGSAPRGR